MSQVYNTFSLFLRVIKIKVQIALISQYVKKNSVQGYLYQGGLSTWHRVALFLLTLDINNKNIL